MDREARGVLLNDVFVELDIGLDREISRYVVA